MARKKIVSQAFSKLDKDGNGWIDLSDVKGVYKADKHPDAKGYIFDGFPRTIPQAEALDKLLQFKGIPIVSVLSLEVPPTTVAESAGRDSSETEVRSNTVRRIASMAISRPCCRKLPGSSPFAPFTDCDSGSFIRVCLAVSLLNTLPQQFSRSTESLIRSRFGKLKFRTGGPKFNARLIDQTHESP